MKILILYTILYLCAVNNAKHFNACGPGGNPKIGKYEYCSGNKSALLINDVAKLVMANDYIEIYDNKHNESPDTNNADLIGCTKSSDGSYCKVNDPGINEGYCVACDVFKFANVAFEMYQEIYVNWDLLANLGSFFIPEPFDDKFLPFKAYIHIGINSTQHMYDDINGLLIFGDGNENRYPLGVLDITAHGLFTNNIYTIYCLLVFILILNIMNKTHNTL